MNDASWNCVLFSYIYKILYFYLYKILKKVITYKRFLAQPPYYLEINYRTLTIILLPKLIDPTYIAYPFFHSKNQFITGLHTVLWGF